MRKALMVLLTVPLLVGGVLTAPVGAQPAPDQVVAVTVLEGVGKVCNAVPGGECGFILDDPLWNGITNNPPAQGLYWPGVGPAAAYSPVEFSAGPSLGPPNSLCVSTLNGPGCAIRAWATPQEARDRVRGVFPSAAGIGAYCGSSKGILQSTFTSAPNPIDNSVVNVHFHYTWEQSAATILPITGTGDDGSILIAFTSSRGLADTGDCGITKATTSFQVEGFTVTFNPSA